MTKQPVHRPIGVTILAILAGILAVLAALFALQGLGILPYVLGPYKVHAFSFWNFVMWGLMVWVYVWLTKMLWNVEPQAWMFLVIITIFNLILDFVVMLDATTTFSDVSVSFILNGIILLYCLLPSVKNAFGVSKTA
jgi:hypothetical protein